MQEVEMRLRSACATVVAVVSKRSPPPRFHTKSGHVSKSLERAYQRFYWAYREAADKLSEGIRDVIFPPGSFPPPTRFVRPHPATEFG